jgi:hypothetical protein
MTRGLARRIVCVFRKRNLIVALIASSALLGVLASTAAAQATNRSFGQVTSLPVPEGYYSRGATIYIEFMVQLNKDYRRVLLTPGMGPGGVVALQSVVFQGADHGLEYELLTNRTPPNPAVQIGSIDFSSGYPNVSTSAGFSQSDMCAYVTAAIPYAQENFFNTWLYTASDVVATVCG